MTRPSAVPTTYRNLPLDRFQAEAIGHLGDGHSVLVAAPTGTGKTLVADWIVEEALRTGKQVIYTAPIKALSNQKFRDYVRLYGESNVGLVTGDLVIRRDAPCRVMTTEILRNMLLAGDRLGDLLAVILDEIHFLDDRERGTVWEEVLIYLPPSVQIVGLSATLSNLRDLAAWMEHVRGRKVAVVEEYRRAVPLTFRFASTDTGLVDLERFEQTWRRKKGKFETAPPVRGRRGRHDRTERRGGRPVQRTRHVDVFKLLREQDLLPYLYFAFSRKDTEHYARDLARYVKDSLLDADDQARIDERLTVAARDLGPALDRELRELYARGIAFHHAGLHVQLKALVEELYEAKLLRVLYCTSTFALGINMPARSVAFDGLKKFDGQKLSPLTTREFMQMAGRAGRRGLDDTGFVVIRHDLEDFEEAKPWIERFRKGAYEPVRSSFNLSWNSVVNLLAQHDEARIRDILSKSFLSWHLRRKSPQQAEERAWGEFQRKVNFLVDVGYLSDNHQFNAGAKVLQHLQISEFPVAELFLSGMLEDLDGPTLFGILCGLTNELPRAVNRNYVLRKEDRRIAREIGDVVFSPTVTHAAEITGAPWTWDPDLVPLGRAWAEGRSLQEILLMLQSGTDVSGDLITGFRRAKDLASQLRDVYDQLPDRAAFLQSLIRTVSRDEVEVID
jgi:superfamily II RNA helicase